MGFYMFELKFPFLFQVIWLISFCSFVKLVIENNVARNNVFDEDLGFTCEQTIIR